MARNGHDCTCSVGSKNEVTHPNWNLLPSKWMDCKSAERYPLLLVEILDSIEFTHVCIHIVHRFPSRFIFCPFDQLFSEGMFGCKCNEANTKQGIWTGCKHANGLITSFDSEFDFSSFRTTKPIFLHQSNTFWEFDGFQSIKQLLSILGDIDEPLTHILLSDRAITTPAASSLDLFIGKNGRT